MHKTINRFFSIGLSALLFFAIILPEVAFAESNVELEEGSYEEFNNLREEFDDVIDQYFNESGLSSIDFEKLNEEEMDEYFNQLLSTDGYLNFENEVSVMMQDQANQISTRAVQIAFIPIGLVALRILVTQGSKAATAYLKKATKKLTKTYKISFKGGNQLIFVQDKKTNKRVFSVDKHPVKLSHKKTGKGYNGTFSAWHFHAPPKPGDHLMLCSQIPKNYKVKGGKCFF